MARISDKLLKQRIYMSMRAFFPFPLYSQNRYLKMQYQPADCSLLGGKVAYLRKILSLLSHFQKMCEIIVPQLFHLKFVGQIKLLVQ